MWSLQKKTTFFKIEFGSILAIWRMCSAAVILHSAFTDGLKLLHPYCWNRTEYICDSFLTSKVSSLCVLSCLLLVFVGFPTFVMICLALIPPMSNPSCVFSLHAFLPSGFGSCASVSGVTLCRPFCVPHSYLSKFQLSYSEFGNQLKVIRSAAWCCPLGIYLNPKTLKLYNKLIFGEGLRGIN